MRLIRSLISFGLLAGFILIAVTVPIGQRTLFGHIKQIWSSDEAQELVDGVKEESGPLYDRVKRGVKAGVKEAGDPNAAPATEKTDVNQDSKTNAPDDTSTKASDEQTDAPKDGATAKKTNR